MIDRMIAWRRWVIAVSALMLVVVAAGAGKLQIDPNNRVFFGEGHEHYVELLEFEARFGTNTNLLFLVTSERALPDDQSFVAAVRWLHENAGALPRVTSVDSLVNSPYVVDDGESVNVIGVLDFVCPVESGCDARRADALIKPHLTNRYVSPDIKSLSIVARVDLFDPSPDEVNVIASSANELVGEFRERFPNLGVSLTGGVPMMNAFFEAAQNDASSLMLWVVAILAGCLYLFLGGLVPALVMISLGVGAVAITMGAAGWAGFVLNTATATVPLIVFTLVVAASMHLFLHIVREERLDDRESVRGAVRAAVASNWRPIVLTALTTVVGLLSMIFVSAPPLKELGVLAAFGVAIGATLTLTAVPCIFACFPRVKASNYLLGLQAVLNGYAKWLERRRPSMFFVALLFCLALAGLGKVVIDEDFVRYFSDDFEFRTDTEEITRRLAGPYHIEIVYDSGESAGVYDSESIETVKKLTGFLRSKDNVVNVASYLDVLAEVADAMGDGKPLAEVDSDHLAQYFLSYELSLHSGQSINDLLDMGHKVARVSVLLGDVSMGDIRNLVEDIRDWASSNEASDRVVVSGEGVPTAYLSSESIREMGVGILVSIVISALIVGLYFRNARAWLTILVATAVPILAGFGVWGWLGSEIGMAATLVVAITLGVVIDDTIHLTYRYVDSLRNLDLTPWGATAYSVHKTGTAILVTSIVLVAGLLVLVTSDFKMNSVFGICSSLIITLALLYNLTLAPRLLSQLR